MQFTGKLDDVEKFACITPTFDILQNGDSLVTFIDSHEWKVDSNEPYGDGFISKIHCSNCGLRYILTGNSVYESAKRAAQYRERKKKGEVEKIAVGTDEALWAVYMDNFSPGTVTSSFIASLS